MADTKITGLLSPQVTTNPATDVLPIVNIADTLMASSGSTRKITVNQLLGAGGTATLASATITGDLTVDTNTLKVDSANNRVGFGTATPAVRMELSVADAAEGARFTASSAWLRMFPYLDATDKTKIQAVNGTNTALSDLTLEGLGLRFNTNAGLSYAISNTSIHTWQNVGGVAGTAMTLNSTGLGVGGSASARIHAIDSGGVCALFTRAAAPAAALSAIYIQAPVSSGFSNTPIMGFWFQNTGISNPASETLSIRTNSAERIRYGSDGNAYHSLQGAVPSIPNNGEMVFNFTSNTNLKISARGSDGITRTADITLAP